jgi:hypothetical protein
MIWLTVARGIESSFPATATQHFIGSKYVTTLVSRTTTSVEPHHASTCLNAPCRRVRYASGLGGIRRKVLPTPDISVTFTTDGSSQVDLKLISLHVPVFLVHGLHTIRALQRNIACGPQLLPAKLFTPSVPGPSLTSLLIQFLGCDNLHTTVRPVA